VSRLVRKQIAGAEAAQCALVRERSVRQKLSWFAGGAAAAMAMMQIWAGVASAYDSYVLNNLRRSRDALLTQQADIQRAYDETSRQVDVLQQKLAKLDGYLRQVDSALRDVNRAIDQAN